MKPTPLIFDDDGSQDGLAALSYILANPKFDLKAITMSHGVARPESEDFQMGLKRMLGFLDATDIPVGIGSAVPLTGDNAFPDFIRNDAEKFYAPFVTLPEEVPDIEFGTAAELLVETINNSPEPVAILSTGSMTNMAEALRIDPGIIDNISVLQIMGGALFVPGNLGVIPEPPFSTNEVAEFNIWLDPVASQEVFQAGENGLNIQLTPLDATNKIEFTREDYEAWLATGTPESILAAEFLDFSLVVVGGDVNPNPLWDMVAAINLSELEFSPETGLHIEIDTESAPGETQGQTQVIPGLPPNTLVSLDPSFDNLSFNAGNLFAYLEESKSVPEPTTAAGLLIFGALGAVLTRQKKQTK
ncbi:nucleoside hydrolase [Limnoraphis robusta CS-951]|uniref:Nucleoside hydrolase n=1 Tax=Limnoraphis robusta CS-951 TaxID=1637645 RepID=A0A0J9EUZ0_9CYAN|nr:nucleoside hydrolase [Limnoraphis robusta CS-951]